MIFRDFQSRTVLSAGLMVVAVAAGARGEQATSERNEVHRIERSETPAYDFSPEEEQLLDAVQRGCFNYLWNEVGTPGCLAKDRRTTEVASLAGVGFQLSSLPIGVERGWITRDEGKSAALTVLRTLRDVPGNRRDGVFLHFVNADTGELFPPYNNEISTVDHTLFLAGAMTAASYFGDEVAEIVDDLAAETNWKAFQAESGLLKLCLEAGAEYRCDGPGEIDGAHVAAGE